MERYDKQNDQFYGTPSPTGSPRMPLRRYTSEYAINKTYMAAEAANRLPYGLKGDSFYIEDPYLMRTIFDDAKASYSSSEPLRPRARTPVNLPTPQNTMKYPEPLSGSSGSPVRNSKDITLGTTPPKKSPLSDSAPVPSHTRNSSTDSVDLADFSTSSYQTVQAPEEPNINDFKYRRSQSLDVTDVKDLSKAIALSRQYKDYIEEYYWELFTYTLSRKEREERLKMTPWKSMFEKERVTIEHLKRETMLLRSRRLCGRLNDFELLKRIGKGAFGEVYLSKRKKSGEILALKRIPKSKIENKNQIAHIKVEQDVLAESSSQWLVQMFYTFQDSEHIYFAMEFIPGGDLHAFLNASCYLPENDAKFYLAEMLVAVDILHSLGYIHRDLKPDNFLIDKDGHIKLIDFGLSTKGVMESYKEPFKGQLPLVKFSPPTTMQRREEFQRQRKNVYSIVGSPDYMSYEILAEKGYDFTADWWSLGCILYEMLVGFPPFSANTPREVFANVMNFPAVLENPTDESGNSIISDTAWDLITRMICVPEIRLGHDSSDEIKNHPFFEGVDWDDIRDKMTPPFKPNLTGPEDTSYFDAEDISNEDTLTIYGRSNTFLDKLRAIPKGIRLGVEAPDILSFARPMISDSSSDHRSLPSPERIEAPNMQRRNSFSAMLGQRRGSIGSSPSKGSPVVGSKPKTKSPTSTLSIRAITSQRSRTGSPGNSKGASWSEAVANIMTRLGQQKPIPPPLDPVLAQLSFRDWQVLCTGAIQVRYKKGHIILREGEKNDCLYRIARGVVRVEKANRNDPSQSFLVGRLEKDQVFGELSFIEDNMQDSSTKDMSNVDFSVIADSEHVDVYKIERGFLFSLFLTDKDLFARFYYVLAHGFAQRAASLPILSKNDRKKIPSHILNYSTAGRLRTSLDITPAPNSPTTMQKNKQKQDSKFRKRFNLPSHEFLIQKYKCTFVSDKKVHGKLYLGRGHFCFYGRIFGYTKKDVIFVQQISQIEAIDDDKICIIAMNMQHFFTKFEMRDETLLLMEQLFTNFNDSGNEEQVNLVRNRRRSSVFIPDSTDIKEWENKAMTRELALSQDDWGQILQAAECINLNRNDVCIKQGECEERIYQIASGSCRVERYDDVTDKTDIVSYYNEREMFGEVSFLLKNESSVSIIAEENNTEVYAVDKSFLDILFQQIPGFAGKFYKFLSLIIARRVKQRELELIKAHTLSLNPDSVPSSPTPLRFHH